MKISAIPLFLVFVVGIATTTTPACRTDEQSPPENKACMLAQLMALPSADCRAVFTGLGWTPDTCYCQLGLSSVDATGKVTRTPMQVVWLKAEMTDEPKFKTVYQIPPPAPAKQAEPKPHKE